MKKWIYLISTLLSVTAQAAPAPTVYTGSFLDHSTGRQQIARLVITSTFKPGQKSPSLSGALTLYFGEENSREYISLFYDPIVILSGSKELFFSRDDDGRARRLPTIRLKFNEDSTEARGELFSHSEGDAGTLTLKLGWTHDVKNPLQGLGGIYDADCGPSDDSGMVLRDLEIVPSRILADKTFPETALGVMNYIGNGTCRRLSGNASCVHLNPGDYNFYRGTVLFHQGSWLWNCERDGDEALNCTSPRYRRCRLELAKKLPMPEYSFGKRPQPKPISWVDFENPAPQGDCSQWNGEFNGKLTHYLGMRQQPISIRLMSVSVGKEPDKCLLSGTVQLFFQSREQISNRISFPIPNTEILASEKHVVLQSDVYTDLTIEIERDNEDRWSGNWISRLFGWVGPFEVTKGVKLVPVASETAIQGIHGDFVWGEKKNWLLNIASIESGLDKSSYDPYVQLKITGSLIMQGEFGERQHPFRVGGMGGSSYDYFTNTLVIRAGSILSGFIDPSGISVRGVSNGYLNYAPERALWIPKFFERCQSPSKLKW